MSFLIMYVYVYNILRFLSDGSIFMRLFILYFIPNIFRKRKYTTKWLFMYKPTYIISGVNHANLHKMFKEWH